MPERHLHGLISAAKLAMEFALYLVDSAHGGRGAALSQV
jgi:hypothetical protein